MHIVTFVLFYFLGIAFVIRWEMNNKLAFGSQYIIITCQFQQRNWASQLGVMIHTAAAAC